MSYKEDPEKKRIRQRKYYREHKKECNERQQRYRGSNREKLRLKSEKYNREHKKEAKEYYKNNYDKIAIVKKKYYREHVKEVRERRIQQDYGMSLIEYEKLFTEQDGVCAICSEKETARQGGKLKELSIDHNHKTGKNRGLLCGRCNAAIGFLKESKELLEKAKIYLLKYDIN